MATTTRYRFGATSLAVLALVSHRVPFDLHISRASSFDVVMGGEAELPPPAPISLEEFHALMDPAPAMKKSDVVSWVRHAEGDPWFAAEWITEGGVERASPEAMLRAGCCLLLGARFFAWSSAATTSSGIEPTSTSVPDVGRAAP
jgi:hypothetical protein